MKGKKVGDAFGGGEEGGVAHGFTRGGVGHGFAKERPSRVVFPGKLDLNGGSGNTNEVLRMGVEDINLQEAIGMKNEFEVVGDRRIFLILQVAEEDYPKVGKGFGLIGDSLTSESMPNKAE